MSRYAIDDDDLIHAWDATPRQTYWCLECDGPVKVRKGGFRRYPYFYHLKAAPSCRLYSKSQDHLLAQLALQDLLPPDEVELEKPFLDKLRVADVVWEPKKLVFEIQCSLIEPHEVKRRVEDYQESGYQVVWLLDDRLFNRPYKLRSGEEELRKTLCYYVSLRKREIPRIYDQFEVFFRGQRLKRGARPSVHLADPRCLAKLEWEECHFPQQVLERAREGRLYFRGDLLHKAVLASAVPALASAMRNFRALETLCIAAVKKLHSPWRRWWLRRVLQPFGRSILYLERKLKRSY